MKNFTTLILILFIGITSQELIGQSLNGQQALSTQATAIALKEVANSVNQETAYESLSDLEFWSALNQMDGYVEVVYKPTSVKKKIIDVPDVNIKSPAFVQAKNKIYDLIESSATQAFTNGSLPTAQDLIVHEDDEDSYMVIKATDPGVLQALRSSPNVDYIGLFAFVDDTTLSDPSENQTTYRNQVKNLRETLNAELNDVVAGPTKGGNETTRESSKEGARKETNEGRISKTVEKGDLGYSGTETNAFGAGGGDGSLLDLGCSGDREVDSPPATEVLDYLVDPGVGSLRPWHFDELNIQIANLENAGEGVKIAILDTGLSESQDNLNEDFDLNYGPRYIATKKTNLWPGTSDDLCGHGTRMTANAAAPQIAGDVRGVAYKADVLNIKSNTDVLLIGTLQKLGVKSALKKIRKNKPGYQDVDIISMSLGYLLPNWGIRRQLKKLDQKGVLMFAAVGTSPMIGNGGNSLWDQFTSAINTATHMVQIYPAKHSYTVGCTGVFDDFVNTMERCETCHIGDKVDFVVPMQKDYSTGPRPIPCISYSGAPHIDYTGGSSGATSTMAGVAALMKAKFPYASSSTIITKLRNSASHGNNRHPHFGWGQVDLSQIFSAPIPPDPDDFSIAITGDSKIVMEVDPVYTAQVTGGNGNFSYNWSHFIPTNCPVSVQPNCNSTTSTFACEYEFNDNPNNSNFYIEIILTVKNLDTNVSKTVSREIPISDIMF